MKKIIAVFAVVLLVGCMAFAFSGCGEDNGGSTTTPSDSVSSTSISTTNPGMVTDVSETDDAGALGELVTDASEVVSDMVTDASRAVSDMAD